MRPGPRRSLEPHDDHASPSLGPMPTPRPSTAGPSRPGRILSPRIGKPTDRPRHSVSVIEEVSLERTLRIVRIIRPLASPKRAHRRGDDRWPERRRPRSPERDAGWSSLPDRSRSALARPRAWATRIAGLARAGRLATPAHQSRRALISPGSVPSRAWPRNWRHEPARRTGPGPRRTA